jgi:hypothetical protein
VHAGVQNCLSMSAVRWTTFANAACLLRANIVSIQELSEALAAPVLCSLPQRQARRCRARLVLLLMRLLGAVLGCWLHSDTCSCKSPPCKSVQATLAYVRQSISTSLLQDAVAIKVYIDPAGFSIEQMVYGRLATSSVGTAPAFCNNADCSASTPYGFVFPPFTVTKKAQPLSEWFEKFEADFVTSMQVRISFMAVIAPCVMCKSHVHTKSASCALRRCNSYIAWCGVSFVWIAAIKC